MTPMPRSMPKQQIGAAPDPVKPNQTTSGDWWSKLTGGVSLPGGGMSGIGSLSSPRAIGELGLGYGQLYGQSKDISSDILAQIAKNLPQRMRYNQQAAESLDPRNDPARYAAHRAQGLGAAQLQGRGAANMMKGQGLGPEAQAAAYLDAQNQAEDRSGQFLSQISSPEARAQRYQQASQLMGMEPYLAELGMTNEQFQTMMQALLGGEQLNLSQEGFKGSQQKGSFLDDLFGIASSVVPFMGFGGGGGGGGSQSWMGGGNRPGVFG